MVLNNKISVTIDEVGIFVNFHSGDSMAALSVPDLAAADRSPTGRTLLKWCRDRVSDASGRLPQEMRAELLVKIDELMQANSELREAAEQSGPVEPISEAWLDEREACAAGAAAVSLSGDQFRELLAAARNGLRPKSLPS